MRIAHGHKSDVGRGRPENEDSFLVDDAHGLYAVADGMGGHRAGEVASATAIETLLDAYGGGSRLDEAVEAANAAVFAQAADNAGMRGMGTTMTAVALEGPSTALLGHVGDSRAYLMRDGAVTQVTDDHSLVEQLVREGRISPEEAVNHPQRAIITRALGVDAEVEVDTYRVDLRPGDRLLLCSDGLTNMLSDNIIGAVLGRQSDPQTAADTLVDMANEAGGDDNITVVVLDALADSAPAPEPEAAALGVPAKDEPTGEWHVVETTAADAPGAGDTAGATDLSGAPFEAEAAAGAVAGDGPTTEADADTGRAARRARRRAAGAGRRMAGVLRWGLPVLAVIAIGVGAVGWYARRTYYVGFSADRVTLFKGVPGGLLGWSPTVDRRTELTSADLTPADRLDVADGHRFANRSDATQFLTRLQEHMAAAGETTTTTTAGNPPGADGPSEVPISPSPPESTTR